MKKIVFIGLVILVAGATAIWLLRRGSSTADMRAMLAKYESSVRVKENSFYPKAKIAYYDSLIAKGGSEDDMLMWRYHKSEALIRVREEEQAIEILEDFIKQKEQALPATAIIAKRWLALSYLRLGEKANCLADHNAASCIMPVQGTGIHRDREATKKAKALYEEILTGNSSDIESRWLYNIVCMTLGDYPDSVDKRWLMIGMAGDPNDTINAIKPFNDIAPQVGLDVKNMAGGVIIEDFDNDGYYDIVSSGWGLDEAMHYYHNNGDGTFADRSQESGLSKLNGGLNIQQVDYNNDGFNDIFVPRGAWKRNFGNEPMSLLRNNGDGTFTDVTVKSGLLSFHPTQAATWDDFNNDGWLDVFVGNETSSKEKNEQHPCELFISNGDGTFTDMAAAAHANYISYIKGVTSGDFDNDGKADIFISSLTDDKMLLRNISNGKQVLFEDVTKKAGVSSPDLSTFPTWFWDFDNDGWLDIFACGYQFTKSLSTYEAEENLGMPPTYKDKNLLYRNNHDGTFTNVTTAFGLDTYIFAMGSNFGDIDNDGYLDMYLGTGNPALQSVIPNRMFHNLGGKKFKDVTYQAHVGHLQKGHAVAFADLDNDGDQDIFEDMGGAYPGDSYPSVFFLNPGQNKNHWISILLKGKKGNRSAIGTRIKVTFRENGTERSVYRDVNSGGSFGSSPFRREIGLGSATMIDSMTIWWTGNRKPQILTNIVVDQFLVLDEGAVAPTKINLKKISWLPVDQTAVLK